MTKKEAIENITEIKKCEAGVYAEALELAIKALEQEPCKDAISRQAAIRLAEQGQVQGFEWQFKKLVVLPPVSVAEKVGKWILTDKEEEIYCHVAICSVCGKESINEGVDDYCSWCGARMVEPQESEE